MRKKLLSCLLTLCMLFSLLPTAALAADANPFTDVKDADWFYDGVLWAEDEGLMNGTTATTFAPNDTTTRGMLVTILWRLAGKPDAKGTQFSDVDDGAYYADATIWGCANDIICGYGDGTFGPNDAITRQQMATILYRYAKYAKYDVTAAADLSDYDDADEVASWAEDALAWANAEGLINGMGDGTLAPAGNATRAQVAAILYRMTKLSPAKEETKPSTSGGSSSGGSSHTHDWVWTSNQDGTHSAVCSKNSSHTKAAEDCNLHGYEACTVCGYSDGNYHIANVDDLLAFAALVNADTDKFAFEGETAVLDADIDMTGKTWTPIAAVFNGTFDGQGNTISNLTIEGTEKVGFFGSAWLASEIKDVNFETITVTGNHFVGTVVGSTYGTVSGCSVTGLTMTVEPNLKDDGVTYDNGDKVGGIAGYSACGEITDCSVTDATISAYRDVGGILGASIKDNINTTVTDCTVENVTINVNQDGEKNYGTKAPNAGGIVGRVDGSVDTTSCTQTNVTINVTLGGTDAKAVAMIGSKAYSTLEAALTEVKAGDTLTMLEDATVSASSGSYGNKVGLTVNGWTLDGAGNTLSVTGADTTWDCGIYITSGTVKNLTVSDSFRGIFSGTCDGDIAIDNVTFENVCYTFNSDKSKADSSLTVTNSALNGWTSYTSGYESVSFTNCTFSKGTGAYTYEFLRAYSDTTITDCTFVGDFQIGSNNSAITITINNSTIDDGRSIFDLFKWSELDNTTVIVDRTYYVGTGAQLKALIEGFEDGTEATIAVVGNINTTESETRISVGTGKDITIVGADKKASLTTWFKVTGLLKLKDLTLVSPSAAVPGETTSQYTRSTIALEAEGDVVCEKVTFDMSNAVDDATAISTWWSTGKGTNITVTDCTFLCAGNRPIRSDACVTVENCTFYNPYRYAVQLTSKASTATGIENAVVNFNNNTIVGGDASNKPVYGIQLEGEEYGCGNLIINGEGNEIVETTRDTAMYYCECSNKIDHLTIVWNTEVEPVHAVDFVAVIGSDLYGTLQEAVNAANDGDVVTLLTDLELTEWTTMSVAGKNFTLDGTGHTISGLNAPLLGATNAGTITIKNLTISDAAIDTSEDSTVEGGLGVGAFVCYMDASGNLTLENCHLKDSTVKGNKRAAGLLSYTTGNTLTITDCSVDNCEIEAEGGAAGLVAYEMTSTSCTIKDSKVTGSTMTATEDRLDGENKKTPLAGGMIGTVQSDITLSDVSVSGNTVSNTNALAVYSDLIGRVVAGTVVIDDVYYATTATELASLIENNTEATIALVGAIESDTAIAVKAGKNITLIGADEDASFKGQLMVTGMLTVEDLTVKTSETKFDGVSQYSYSAIALTEEGKVECTNVTFDMSEGSDQCTAISTWWSTGKGTNITVTDCTFLCAGNRPIRSDACVTVEGCEFNDPYRYAVQMTSKSSSMDADAKAVVNFNNNTIVNGENGKNFVYGVQLEGGYGCHDLIINGTDNTIEAGEWDTENESTMYYCECGVVDHDTIVWNTDVYPVHEDD